jgi:hypothetical protein
MRREFGVDEETMFEKWDYWQFKAYLKAIPKVLGTTGKEEPPAPETAIDTSEMDLGQLAQVGLNVKGGPG